MKLARPEVFHPKIVFAGGPDGGDGADAGLVAALRRRGLHAVWRCWDDPETLRADLVILRAGDDGRSDEFLDWTGRVCHLLNAAAVVAWNAGHRYRRDLQTAGVPTVPDEPVRPPPATTSLVFFGGAQSHAFAPTGAADADFELWELGRSALQAAAAQLGIDAAELLYARADVVGDRTDARLAALDLTAPSLGWQHLDDGTRELQQRRFALCVESALQRFGLGPWSHRRP